MHVCGNHRIQCNMIASSDEHATFNFHASIHRVKCNTNNDIWPRGFSSVHQYGHHSKYQTRSQKNLSIILYEHIYYYIAGMCTWLVIMHFAHLCTRTERVEKSSRQVVWSRLSHTWSHLTYAHTHTHPYAPIIRHHLNACVRTGWTNIKHEKYARCHTNVHGNILHKRSPWVSTIYSIVCGQFDKSLWNR